MVRGDIWGRLPSVVPIESLRTELRSVEFSYDIGDPHHGYSGVSEALRESSGVDDPTAPQYIEVLAASGYDSVSTGKKWCTVRWLMNAGDTPTEFEVNSQLLADYAAVHRDGIWFLRDDLFKLTKPGIDWEFFVLGECEWSGE